MWIGKLTLYDALVSEKMWANLGTLAKYLNESYDYVMSLELK
ncbi:MAG: hypothetical protein WBM55_10375 [Muriicola sp.]